MKIRALNEPDSSSSVSEESQQAQDGKQQQVQGKEAIKDKCFGEYRRALIAIKEQRDDEAKEILSDINNELKGVDESEGDNVRQLKFSVLRNLGNLTNNIDHYIKALEIDSSDISLWIKTGDRSLIKHNITFARFCYEQALSINAHNWIAIDKLMELYYVLNLPIELYDICLRALSMNEYHHKAKILLRQAKSSHRSSDGSDEGVQLKSVEKSSDEYLIKLEHLRKRHSSLMQDSNITPKRPRLSITLDTTRTQTLVSFGNYIIRIYERSAKQYCLTRDTIIDVALNSSSNFAQQQTTNGTANSSQSNNQASNEAAINNTSSQDVEMLIEAEGASNSEAEKYENRNEPTTSNDDNEQSKSSSRSKTNNANQKNSSLTFAAMLFPLELGDKRRSSRNRTNQDDSFMFKMKFDELNNLLPKCLRIGAIEQALERRRAQSNATKQPVFEDSVSMETNLDPIKEDIIIKDIIETISGQAQSNVGPVIKDIKLCDIIHTYLTKVSMRKQNHLPEVFLKMYKIYRKLCPLPTNNALLEIGPNSIDVDEIWFTLTANELSYQYSECMFLLRIADSFELALSNTGRAAEFSVRLFLILGQNFHHPFLDMALQNIEENKILAPNRKVITRAHIKTLRDQADEKLAQVDEDNDDDLEIINRLAPKSETEMSDREINLLCNAIKSAKIWQRGLDVLNQRNDLSSDIIMETINICLKNGAKMDAILASKLCKDAVSGARPISWTCLFRGWIGVLTEDELQDEDTILMMDKFFELGHRTLGKKGPCTSDNGEFLMLQVKHLLNDDRDNFEERDLLGALYCLFGYPSKRPSSTAGHKPTRIPITWEYAQIIYSYLEPEELPTYMSLLRKVGITSELEIILKEIATVVPEDLSPAKHVEIIEDYINKDECLRIINIQHNEVTKDLYYLLADYYFKNKDFSTAKIYYHYDLVLNPDRFDSWAASGLIRASGIDKALSEGAVDTENFVQGPFHELANSAISCFSKATSLKPDEPKATLWIEFGNLTYNLLSLAARLYLYDDFGLEYERKDPVYAEKLVKCHKALFRLSKKCYKSANEKCVCDEVWLHYYMLGKLYEKVDVFKALEYYTKADAQLFEEGASYPKKISYHNPPDLAYEAMEIHYRIHASAQKFLLNCPEITQDQMNRLRRHLLNAQRSPFVEMESLTDPRAHLHERVDRDVGLVIEDVVDSVAEDATFDELIYMCLHGMKRCLIRCDKNFKALYRLAYYYYKIRYSRMAQDILIAKELKTDRRITNILAMNPDIPEWRAAPPDLQGLDSLFRDRKMGNLFFNIWRMPVEEIDRPGCFEHWMFKCTWLLIKTSSEVNDTDVLSVVAFQLSRQPETPKKYLQDRPRLLLALFAVQSIIKIVHEAIDKATSLEERNDFIREGLALSDRFIKANVFVDQMRDLYNQLQDSLTSDFQQQQAQQ